MTYLITCCTLIIIFLAQFGYLCVTVIVSDEAFDIITFGKSTKKSLDSQLIGMYGNGLKSYANFLFLLCGYCTVGYILHCSLNVV